MDFDLSDDQRLLKDSVDRFVKDRYGFEARKKHRAGTDGWSREVWSELAGLGLLGLPFAEADGGFGGGPVDTGLVMEAFGRGLVVEPYFPSVILCGALLRHGATAEQRADLVAGLVAGDRVLAYAQAERQSRYALNDIKTAAQLKAGQWRIDGAKTLVLHGDAADDYLVTARIAGHERDRDGIGLFHVAQSAAGVTRRGYPTQDGMRAADVTFEGAAATSLGEAGAALPAMERAQDEAIAALCAEAVGLMSVMHEMTVDYLKTRTQFGRPIGENQVLQHRAVDMFVSLEQARSMALYATMMASSDDATERRRAIHAAKVQIGKSGRHVGQEAIQLHGGIGVTMEYAVGHYFKRMTMIERTFGDTQMHLGALARLGGLIAA
jgi:pimeloyl-CoA dehydrogenase small subunit